MDLVDLVNLVDLVDLELRSNWRVLRYWGIFNDTHVINVIYIIYIELEQFHQCSSYTTRWRETETSTRTIIIWLVVSNMFYSSIYWE